MVLKAKWYLLKICPVTQNYTTGTVIGDPQYVNVARKEGQNAPGELKGRDFRQELEEKERRLKDKRKPDELEEGENKKRRIEAPKKEEPQFNPLDRDDPDSSDESSSGSSSSDERYIVCDKFINHFSVTLKKQSC